MDNIKTDVLIIGGGGAACRAAVAAADAGADVTVVLRGTLGRSGATTYQCCEIAGYNVSGSGDPQDSPEVYYEDIMDAGMGMADPRLAELLAHGAGPRFEDLRRWGVSPAADGGREVIMKGCYSSRRRGYTIRGHGEPIAGALIRQMRARLSINVMENSAAAGLLMSDGICSGADVLLPDDSLARIYAGAVILATGGASRVFLKNLNPADVCGDGYSMAWECGADLMNMEFMQAGVGFFHPVKSLFNTYLWAGFPLLTNASGERFLEKYLPSGVSERDVMLAHCRHFPFSSRDASRYIEIGIQKELASGGGNERMNLQVRFEHFTNEYIAGLEYDADLKALWPMVKEHFLGNGVDLLRDTVEVTCVAQAVNGGIRIDVNSMSTIPGLFAAGETAAGPHGADRLGGNMMVTCQVFGEIAGRKAAEWALRRGLKARGGPCGKEAELLYKDVNTAALTDELQRCAMTDLFICRTAGKLEHFLNKADELEREFIGAKTSDAPRRENLAFYSLLNSARIMARSALLRKESRGSHYREDFPYTDDENFGAPIIVKKNG
ncbi:MAG TPA: FAD-binding protein [Anaerovoracaceae bacterium]|nr:FAD-binding protein [Anaerovoracaceae bacterium]